MYFSNIYFVASEIDPENSPTQTLRKCCHRLTLFGYPERLLIPFDCKISYILYKLYIDSYIDSFRQVRSY